MMIKAKLFMLVPAALLLSNCAKQNPTPFEVDVVKGSYSVFLEGGATGTSGIEVNGKNILQGAFLFQEMDKLVAIGSHGLMDVMVEFSGDSASGTIGLTLFNHGDKQLAVNQVRLFSIRFEEAPGAEMISKNQVQISGPGNQLCLKAGSEWPWTLGFHIQGNQLCCRLDLSNSSMVLLPEEKVSLPQLAFFYHLCPQ
ncbi:MAG: hypothetical protein V2B15_03275 [Bacteroidota bacterium]